MAGGVFRPTETQRRIIEAGPGARLIVDAGPGTGKTATAAARVLYLLDSGVSPGRLWMVSFARAAVAEMRQRLIAFGGDRTELPQVTTLDSLAGRLRGGDLDGDVRDGYDPAVAETLALLKTGDTAMLRRLATVEHILFDETQDMVGHRAALAAEIIQRLREATGVTILTDEAQAIYGFSAGASLHSLAGETLAQHCLAVDPARYRPHVLTDIHRTDEARLLRLFARTRTEVMRIRADPSRKLAAVRHAVERGAKPLFRRMAAVPEGSETLVIYRSRAEVLLEATRRFDFGIPFRVRLSGLPPAPFAWLGAVLEDASQASFGRDEFLGRWDTTIGDDAGPDAWDRLLSACGGESGRIALAVLHRKLTAHQPPFELCMADPGDASGSVIGTIHASKGREMDNVRLMMPRGTTGRDDPEAEARVLFVGATRARRRLELGQGGVVPSKRLPSGRVLARSTGKALIELGRPGDFVFDPDKDRAELVRSLRHGDVLTLGRSGNGFSLECRGVAIAAASPDLLQDIRQARAYFHPELDYRTVETRFGPVRCLCLCSHASRNPQKIFQAPVVAGFSTVDFYRI